jgi:hypothetical protein
MTDLETKLAAARERFAKRVAMRFINSREATRTCIEGFDACAKTAREVVAEKDAEIARLEAALAGCDEHGIIGAYLEALEDARQLRAALTEKDAEIARLRSGLDTLGKTVGERAEVVGRRSFDSPTAPEQPHKVTDVQREAIREALSLWWGDADDTLGASDKRLMDRIVAILESTDEPPAK